MRLMESWKYPWGREGDVGTLGTTQGSEMWKQEQPPRGGPKAWQLQGFHHKAKDRGKCPCEYVLRSQEEVDLLLKGSEFQKGQRGGVVRKVGQAW